MRHLGAPGLGSATSREREARPGPATGPNTFRSRAPTPLSCPRPQLQPLTGPQGRFFTRSAMFVAHCRPRPANQTHPFRPHRLRAVQSESQCRAGAWLGVRRLCERVAWDSQAVGLEPGRGLVAGFGGPKGNLCSTVPDPWTTGEPPSDSTRARHLKLSSILFYVGTLRPRAEV